MFIFSDKCVQSKKQYHATIELQGLHTRGQMVLDHLKKNNHNVTIIETFNEEEFKKVLHWTATS